MAKLDDTGVYQKENGFWEYRFIVVVDGKQIARKKCTDEFGNKLKTKREAVKARAAALARAKFEPTQQKLIPRKTMAEVYDEYCEKGRSGKAYSTIVKQESLWKNHLSPRFGHRFIDEISVAEIDDYLAELYHVEGKAYRYVEGFLKMFYLIFGQAYSRNYLAVDIYNKLCVNKDSKIRMPKLKIDEDTDIVSYNDQELGALDEYFRGTNAETAYLLGRYCGLRINECYGLRWKNVDLEKGTILIDCQEQYQDGLIKLVPPKTRSGVRTIYLCPKIKAHLTQLAAQREIDQMRFSAQRQQNQTFIAGLNGEPVSSLDLVNCLPNGKIQTVNSMKFHSRTIKEEVGIDFKYHHLRHTYGTKMAEMNTPAHLLCNQMGHANINVTQLYYLAISDNGIKVLVDNLSKL